MRKKRTQQGVDLIAEVKTCCGVQKCVPSDKWDLTSAVSVKERFFRELKLAKILGRIIARMQLCTLCNPASSQPTSTGKKIKTR
jgi:hypothetical protein